MFSVLLKKERTLTANINFEGNYSFKSKAIRSKTQKLWPDEMNLIIFYLFYLYLVYYRSCKAALY